MAVAGTGVALALGATVYFLSKEDKLIVYDPNIHTRDKLLEVMEDM
jgi:hypothetical protein